MVLPWKPPINLMETGPPALPGKARSFAPCTAQAQGHAHTHSSSLTFHVRQKRTSEAAWEVTEINHLSLITTQLRWFLGGSFMVSASMFCQQGLGCVLEDRMF